MVDRFGQDAIRHKIYEMYSILCSILHSHCHILLISIFDFCI